MFNQHKHYLPKYIDDLLTKYDKIIFEGLDRGARHMIYINSKNYIFEKVKNNVIDVYNKKKNNFNNVNEQINNMFSVKTQKVTQKLMDLCPLHIHSASINKLNDNIDELKTIVKSQGETIGSLNDIVNNLTDKLHEVYDNKGTIDYEISGIYNLSYGSIFINISFMLIVWIKYMIESEL